jgi:hypothetical protein
MYHYENWDVYRALLELREIAAKLSVLMVLSRAFPHEELVTEGRSLCERASAMMANLIRSVERSSGVVSSLPSTHEQPQETVPSPTRASEQRHRHRR